jgi:hypothetical protein
MIRMMMLCAALAQGSYARELDPVAFLAAGFEGEGKSLLGPYQETQSGEWGLNKTVLVVRTRSFSGDMTYFEDLRIFSWDNAKKKIRLRQYAMGDLAEYDVEVKDGGKTLVFQETTHEGRTRKEWRYTVSVKGPEGFSYRVESKEGAAFADYVAGTLRRKN